MKGSCAFHDQSDNMKRKLHLPSQHPLSQEKQEKVDPTADHVTEEKPMEVKKMETQYNDISESAEAFI